MQLLAKDPADRFPNTQVLARHLQAMANGAFATGFRRFRVGRRSSGQRSRGGRCKPIARDRCDAGRIRPEPVRRTAGTRKTTRFAARTSPASQNAATLAADEVLAKQASQIAGSTIAPNADALRQAALNRPTRFTTVEEEEALRRAQQQRSWLVMAGQLAATVAVLGMIGAIAWHLSRPPRRTSLYASVMSRVESDEGGSLLRVENEVNDFIARFPDDPRVDQFERYKERIELDKLERKLQRKTRGSAATDPTLLAVGATVLARGWNGRLGARQVAGDVRVAREPVWGCC